MRVGVLGAGGPAGVNVCRALHEVGHEVVAYDADRKHLIWAAPYAEETRTMPRELPVHSGCDVLMAQPDPLVLGLSANRSLVDGVTGLPSQQSILLCQDKFESGLAWRREQIREDKIYLVDSEPTFSDAAAQLGVPYWLRARHGAGARGAILVREWEEGYYWYRYWKAREENAEFVAEGFLPGRDFSWCGIFWHGALLASFARERLEYLYPSLTPEGLTGTPTIAKVIEEPRVAELAVEAVMAVAMEKPHGVYCVDLREDAHGWPRPTEINAGRFSTTVGLWSLYSPLHANFVALAAELALGDHSRLEHWEGLPEGLTLYRNMDCEHQFVGAPVAVR